MRTIDVVVVSYNSSRYLPRLAAGLRNSQSISSVWVIDNCSTDNSVDVARDCDWGAPVNVKVMPTNVGFGAAVNYGALSMLGLGQHILVINPDVVVEGHTVDLLRDELASSDRYAVIGTSLTTSAGAPVSSARRFPSVASILRRRPVDVDPHNSTVDADWICGAFMLWERHAYEAVGGFSEEYFLYFEDVDICMKAWRSGWSVGVNGKLSAIHDQGHGKITASHLRAESRRSRRIYAGKWLGPAGAVAARIADVLDLVAPSLKRLIVRGRVENPI